MMKKFKSVLAVLVAIAGISPAFISCSSDKEEPATPSAELIAGSYKGDLDCSVMGSVSTFENVDFVVKAIDESTVEVTTPAFGEAPMAMPAIAVAGVKVAEKDGTVELATTEVSGETETGRNYTITLSGSVEGKTLSVKFNLQYGAMPMPLICSSEALKQ